MPDNPVAVRSLPAAFGTGAVIGTLGGLIGLGGAEFRLPLLISLFRFRGLEAVILNKATSLVVVATALPFRARTIPVTAIGDHWSIIVNLLAGSLIGAWVGAEWATRLKSETLYKVIAVLLVIIAGVLLLAHDTTASAPAFTGWMGYRCRIRHRGDRFMTQVRPTNLGHFRALLDWRWRKCARVEGLTMSRRYCGVGLGLTVKQKR